MNGPMISGINFLDSQSREVLLDNNQSVLSKGNFVINFNYLTSDPETVAFTDYQSYPVAFETEWSETFTLVVSPMSNRLFNTEYGLSVDAARKSSDPGSTTRSNNTAVFKTTAA